jgi:hypothetical protein
VRNPNQKSDSQTTHLCSAKLLDLPVFSFHVPLLRALAGQRIISNKQTRSVTPTRNCHTCAARSCSICWSLAAIASFKSGNSLSDEDLRGQKKKKKKLSPVQPEDPVSWQ